MTDHLEVSREIAAPPEAVYDAISDVTRMGEWSDECHTCEWRDGATEAAVGVMFDGHNRNGDHEWTTQGRIVAADRGRRFEFHAVHGDFHFATWAYVIEPTDGGCRVTEVWDDLRPESVRELGPQLSGVADRAEHNRLGMERTLERLAAAVEA